jgi:hypothetical protein
MPARRGCNPDCMLKLGAGTDIDRAVLSSLLSAVITPRSDQIRH